MRKSRNLLISALILLSATVGAQAQKKITVSGFMTDLSSGEPLISSAVLETGSRLGTVTNNFGYYSLTIVPGESTLEYSYLGYQTQTVKVNLQRDTVIDVRMALAPMELAGAVVTANQSEMGVKGTQMSAIEIPVNQIKSIPAIGGEVDVLKALQLLPGVQSGTEGSAGMYVRGGGPDENLLLLDGVPLYNVNHMMGFFSVFDADAIKNVTLYKGSFPARFGSRLSGVIDVRLKDGNDQDFHWGFSVGLLAAKFNMEGPIVKGKTTFNFSFRRTYYDVISAPIMMAISKRETDMNVLAGYYFYDASLKLTHKFSNRDKLFLSCYMGDDDVYANIKDSYDTSFSYSETEDGPIYNVRRKSDERMKLSWQWGNIVSSLRWNHIFSPKLFMNTTLNYTRYRHTLGVKLDNVESTTTTGAQTGFSSDTINVNLDYNSLIDDISAGVDFEYKPSPAHDIKFGGNYIFHTFKPSVSTISYKVGYTDGSMSASQAQDTTFGDNNLYTREAALYFEDNISLADWFKVNCGVHGSMYKTSKYYGSIEPRLSMRFLVNNDLSFKASYSMMSQYLHLLSNSNLSLPTDLWVPVTDRIKPMRSNQVAAGAFYSWNVLDFSIEGYYKTMDNVVEYRDGASFLGTTSGWEDKVAMGRGWSYGVEFLVQKKVGNTTGWVGYTWSHTMRQFDREDNIINFGRPFPAKYDRRHDLSIVVTHKFTDKIDASGTFVFGTGICGTLAIQEVRAPNYSPEEGLTWSDSTPYFEDRNNYRMPSYQRLDLGVNFHKRLKKGGERIFNISVYNAYNRQNPFLVYESSKTVRGEDSYLRTVPILKQLSIFPIMPSLSWSYKF